MMYLINPVVLRLRQNQVLLSYPFHYLSAVNGKASEIVVNYENTQNFSGCDDTSKVNPTCGLKHNRGKEIPFSEGFCCFCPNEPTRVNQARGGQDCSLDIGDINDPEKQKFKASAHCLDFSDIWYTVSALSEPTIFHETFLQVYNLKHLKNGSSVWVALTHEEDFELSAQNPFQFDENETIAVSYMTAIPKESVVTIPINERRLLTPQQMPGVKKLPDPVKNGGKDFLLLPKSVINPEGDDCDVSGVSYEAFSQQDDKCNVEKNTCLKNQPLDFWEMDNAKRKSGGKGEFLLENFGTPYKEPIIIDPDSKQHFLGLEYEQEHLTVVTVEFVADEITILTIGKSAQISKIISSSSKSNIDIFISVLNRGLMPAKFFVQVVKCQFGVPDSKKESVVIPPQMTEDVLLSTKPGSVTLDEEFTCTVEISSEAYSVVAERSVRINPLDRCVCNYHCECACLLDKSLGCEVMEEEDYLAAGFQGSLPVLTAKPPHQSWPIKHPFLALLAFLLLLLLFGFVKGLLGLAKVGKIGSIGMHTCLYQPRIISEYLQPDLRNLDVVYDDEGYPINPDTKKRVRVIGEEWLFVFNLFFCFFWPCLRCKDCIQKAMKKKKVGDKEETTGGEKGDTKHVDKELTKEEGDDKKTGKTKPKTDLDALADKSKDLTAGKATTKPTAEEKTAKKSPSAETRTAAKAPQKPQASRSDSLVQTRPIADPLNKELEKWKKGKRKAEAVRK